MTQSASRVLLSVLLIWTCGCGAEAPPPPEGAQATFAKMQALLRARDWNALYALYAPSERARAEGRWDAMRADANTPGSPHKSRVDGFALEVHQSAAAVAAMDLRSFFAARNAAQAAANPAGVAAFVRATINSTKKIEDDMVMLRIQIGENEQELPLKREGGTWYLSRTLAALTDF